MIIKPLTSNEEFERYYLARREKYTMHPPYENEKDNLEIDVYDIQSFHFAAYEEEDELIACTRLVPDILDYEFQSSQYDQFSNGFISNRRQVYEPENSLSFVDFLMGKPNSDKPESYFSELRNKGIRFNEISRLINVKNDLNRKVINYMICYAWAYNMYKNIDLCFFVALPAHCAYYERFFKCKQVLSQYDCIPPTTTRKNFKIMQADIQGLDTCMRTIVDKIHQEFKKNQGICPVSIANLN